jgi:two-component system NarL family sensor kinase
MAAAILLTVAGGIVLQLLSGGLHGQTLGPALLGVLLALVGPVVIAKRPTLRIGQLLLANAAMVGIGSLAAGTLDYGSSHPLPRLVAQVSFAALWLTAPAIAMWALFILWFPDGRFPSRAWRRFFVAGALACVTVAVARWLAGPADHVYGFYGATAVPAGAAGPFAGAWDAISRVESGLLAFPLVSLAALVQRYRHGSAVLRQQTRWLLVGISIQVLAQVAASAVAAGHGTMHGVGTALSVATQPLPVLGGTVAILRYRLWEIDLVVSRALVYGALWAGLSALLLVPALTAGLLVGGRGALTAVAIVLLVTVVFHPTRSRLERVVERLVYRHRAPPYALLTGLADTLRVADLDRIGPLLAAELHEALAVDWAGVWGVDGSAVRSLATSGGNGGSGQHHNPGVRPLRLDRVGSVDARHRVRRRQLDVHQDDVGLEATRFGDDLVVVSARTDHLDVVALGEQAARPLAHQVGVLGDEDAHRPLRPPGTHRPRERTALRAPARHHFERRPRRLV